MAAAKPNKNLKNISIFDPMAAPALGPTSSILNRNEPSRNTAPFEPSDIEPLVEICLQCPEGALTSRVFQQHRKHGTCWHDSLYMILFQADFMKPVLAEHIRLFLTTMLELGHTDLVYSIRTTNEYKEKDEIIKEEIFDRITKIQAIGKKFREVIDYGLPLQWWEFYCIALHRYILLGYMFLKSAEPIEPRLYKRRGSIAPQNFETLHRNFKISVLNMWYTGLYCSNFAPLKKAVVQFISVATKGAMAIYPIDVSPPEKQAIYIGLGDKHVVCLFVCGGAWYVYDNDIGVAKILAEDAVKLSSLPLKSIKISLNATRDSIEYEFKIEDAPITIGIPFEPSPEYKAGKVFYSTINPEYSFVIGHS
jgi:hypothetical protein